MLGNRQPAPPAGVHEQTTREGWHQIHDLLNKGVGLLECARRLNLSLNTVKRCARTREPQALRRAPRYRPTLVDPYRNHLRERRAADPAKQLFREIQEQGCPGSFNLLYRYITQGRAEGDRPVTTPRRLARLLLTRPDDLRDKDTQLLGEVTAACPEMTELVCLIREFAKLLTPAVGNDAKLTRWLAAVHTSGLPHPHAFANGLELDRAAVNAGLTRPHHNGRTEGVNTRTKRIMRQMHGRAVFALHTPYRACRERRVLPASPATKEGSAPAFRTERLRVQTPPPPDHACHDRRRAVRISSINAWRASPGPSRH